MKSMMEGALKVRASLEKAKKLPMWQRAAAIEQIATDMADFLVEVAEVMDGDGRGRNATKDES